MEKLLVLLVIFFQIQFSSAQAYRPFLVDSAHWVIVEGFCIGQCDPGNYPDPNDFYYTNIIQLKIDGDTIVQGAVYKKLIQNLNRTCMCPQGNPGPYPPGFGPCNTLGILWEDTNARKVYIKKVNEPYAVNWCAQDSLLFDFSKVSGDSIGWPYSCVDTSFIIDSFNNSTVTFNPSQFIHWTGGTLQYTIPTWYIHPNGYFGGFQLYESIGSSLGFWGSIPSFEGSYSSVLLNYCIGSDSACGFTCDPLLGISNPSQNISISVYPNPAKDILTIDLLNISPNGNLKFVVTDLLGQEIYSQAITNIKTEVTVSAFSSGIYLWHLLSEGNIIRSGKVVHD